MELVSLIIFILGVSIGFAASICVLVRLMLFKDITRETTLVWVVVIFSFYLISFVGLVGFVGFR